LFADERAPRRLVIIQVASVFVIVLGLLFVGTAQSLAAMLGGGSVVLPNAWFAFRMDRTRRAGAILGLGILKIVLVIACLALVLILFEPEPVGFFTALSVALLVQIIGPMVGSRSWKTE
jgi:F0F1-type ATP synthase assembly protein I